MPYALRVLGSVGIATAVFGLLFIPSPNSIRVEGEVSEIPGCATPGIAMSSRFI